MGVTAPIVVDTETKAIRDRPHYPPKPVGLAIRMNGKTEYYAYGHPSGNSSTRETVQNILTSVWKSGKPVLFHNGPFDMEVIEKEFGLPMLPEERWHDSMILAFLRDPHARSLGLKELAQTRLGVEPDEQLDLKWWILENVAEAKHNKANWGEYISYAPGNLVRPYGIGDVNRTLKLFNEDLTYADEKGMLAAYKRERRIIPMLLENSKRGVRVDVVRLEKNVPIYRKQLAAVDAWICKTLKTPNLNINATAELVEALDKSGKMEAWLTTPKGKRSVSKASLEFGLRDPVLKGVLLYREALSMCLGTFMEPWLTRARESGGFVHIDWNSTRQDSRTRGGSRTGRISSTPNFQNIYGDENLDKADKGRLKGWHPLPHVRGYIICDDLESLLLDRDFSQQELRVLAHYENGEMLRAYQEDPGMDLHAFAQALILQNTGIHLARKATKTIAFGLLYGMGIDKLAARLDVPYDEAKAIRSAYLDTFPGVKELMLDLKSSERTNEFMRTWGGRVYYAEETRIDKKTGQRREFGYKLTNYLIQGSSADITKEAMIRYNERKKNGRFLLTVHDQIVINAPKKAWKEEMAILKDCMNSIELDAPFLSTGAIGERWTDMEELKE